MTEELEDESFPNTIGDDNISPELNADIETALSIGRVSQAARRLETSKSTRKQPTELEEEEIDYTGISLAARERRLRRGRAIKNVGKGILATAAGGVVVAGAWGIGSAVQNGLDAINDNGNRLPDSAEIDKNIYSIDVAAGATFREGPHVKDDADNHNGIFITTAPGTIVGESRIYTSTDNNGEWFGVSGDWVLDEFHDQLDDQEIAAIKKDADNIIWVNEQKVTVHTIEDKDQ